MTKATDRKTRLLGVNDAGGLRVRDGGAKAQRQGQEAEDEPPGLQRGSREGSLDFQNPPSMTYFLKEGHTCHQPGTSN